MDTPNINGLNGLISDASFFDISRYLNDKYLTWFGDTTSPGDRPPNGPSKDQCFKRF